MSRVAATIMLAMRALTVFLAVSEVARAVDRYDTVIRHGTVFDGSGAPHFLADIGIRDGHIAEIGDLSSATAATEIDATGLFVAPGFINIHDHSSPQGLVRAENMLTQGVTLGVANADGMGSVDLPRQFAEFTANGLAMNIALSIGFNSVWSEVVGLADRRPTEMEIARMQSLIEKGLEDGAVGVSAGLDYKPGYFSTVSEAIKVLRPAGKWRTFFPNHDRLAPPAYSSRQGMMETVEIASGAHLVPELTHIKLQGLEQGQASAATRMMDAAGAAGHYTAADIYPYLAGQTNLAALLIPAWAQDGGREEMLKRFARPELRDRIAREAEAALSRRFGGPSGVFLIETRQELTDIMRAENASAGETLIRVLEKADPNAILRFGAEEDVVALLKHPVVAVACDCGASPHFGGGHPRTYGTFPRVLGKYVRERRILTWEDAVRKMTGLPASSTGIVNRGFLAPGMAADCTIFDPKTIDDTATYEKPDGVSRGIRYVLVNGKMALSAGMPTGIQGGQQVTRTLHMPSRPMTMTGYRRVVSSATFRGPAGSISLSMNVWQTPDSHRAIGTIRLEGRTPESTLVVDRLGMLQVAHGWASLTGWTKAADGRGAPVTLILDKADPMAPRGTGTLTVETRDWSFEGRATESSIQISPTLPPYL